MPRRSADSAQGPSIQPSIQGRSPPLAQPLAKEGRRLHAVVHPAATHGIGHLQAGQHRLVGQEGFHLVDRWRLVVEELHLRPAVGGLAGRIRDARYVVETERLRGTELGFDHDAMVGRIAAIGHAGDIGGEHHRNRHPRQAVHRPAFQHGENAVIAVHRWFPEPSPALTSCPSPKGGRE